MAPGEAKPLPRVVVDRTSGDEESTGQTPNAQLAMTVQMAARGAPVLASYGDADVSGTVPWAERPGLQQALAHAAREGAALYVREVSRLSRFEPCRGLLLLETVPNLDVEGAQAFSRRGGAWVDDSSEAHLFRFIGLWTAWNEKRHVAARTAQKMAAIKEGAVETKSGRPMGRPVVEIAPEHVARAREMREAGSSWTDVREEVLKLRGFYEVKDPEARARREVSADSIKRALGVKPKSPRGPGQKADPGTSGDAAAGEGPVVKGSLVPGRTKPDAEKVPDETTVDARGETPRGNQVLSSEEGEP
jgi:DNA invertase Pin-like site-specific DNA recombinase